MKLIKNFVLLLSGILGASAGIIFLALINVIGNFDLSFSHVFVYGLAGGVLCGWITALIGFFMIRKWIRKKLHYHSSKLFNWSNIRLNRFR